MKTTSLYSLNTYNESQSFNRWWLVLSSGIALFGGLMVMIKSQNHSEWSTLVIMMMAALPLLVFGLMAYSRLNVRIDSQGIHVKYRPFHVKTRVIRWDEIEQINVSEYKPMQQFGGWGIRHSWKHGKAWSIRGKQGIHIVLKDGSKITVGTQQPEKVKAMIAQHFNPSSK